MTSRWMLQHDDPVGTLQAQGFALLTPSSLASRCHLDLVALMALQSSWRGLPPDAHLRDTGAYRRRRHASYVLAMPFGQLSEVPHRAHWQPTAYNALHGGIARWFDPIAPQVAGAPAFQQLIIGLGGLFRASAPVLDAASDRWFIEAHQFRIDTAAGIGRPTPEGAHRDGVDFVAVILVNRVDVRGGETRVFQADAPDGVRFTLTEPWSALLLDDARVIHETTPIQPDVRSTAPTLDAGTRDTLVLTYRRGGFQDP